MKFYRIFQKNFSKVFDARGSKGLYSVVGKHGIYYKSAKGATTSGAVVQMTKNFPTLSHMTGNDEMLEINQKKKSDKFVPVRDTFYLSISGDLVDPQKMKEDNFFDSCFDPSKILFNIVERKTETGYQVLQEDFAKCYYKTKLVADVANNVTCKNNAVVNGKPTANNDLLSVLLFSDITECVANKK